MPSHLSSIGFRIDSPKDLSRLAEELSPKAETVTVKKGKYLRWTGTAGEQLWLQVNSRRELVGINPHFDGQTRLRVGVVGRVSRADDTHLDGAFHAWASPGEAPQDGEYPFVFDAPDAATYSELEVPSVAEAQITAFAHELSLFDSEDAYNSAQGTDGAQFASRSFIPSGMFMPDGRKDRPPAAEAIFTGQILQAEFRTNAASGMQFWRAVVDTLGGRYDVVADPVLLQQQPVVGGYLSGTFWLSGRLVTYSRKKKSWFGQLLGGAG